LSWKSEGGSHVVSLGGSNKWSPYISVALHFGCRFDAATKIERIVSGHVGFAHISQSSRNRQHMQGIEYSGPYEWEIDIREPFRQLVPELTSAINGIARPFHARFSNMVSARNALVAHDPWCPMVASMWPRMLYLDGALSDLAHFREWSKSLPDFYRQHALDALKKLEETLSQ
jgi:hypothetical protein